MSRNRRARNNKSAPIKVEDLGYPSRNPDLSTTSGTFFSRKHQDCAGIVNQPNINVNVTIEQADDCLTSCIGALAGCFGKGAAGA